MIAQRSGPGANMMRFELIPHGWGWPELVAAMGLIAALLVSAFCLYLDSKLRDRAERYYRNALDLERATAEKLAALVATEQSARQTLTRAIALKEATRYLVALAEEFATPSGPHKEIITAKARQIIERLDADLDAIPCPPANADRSDNEQQKETPGSIGFA